MIASVPWLSSVRPLRRTVPPAWPTVEKTIELPRPQTSGLAALPCPLILIVPLLTFSIRYPVPTFCPIGRPLLDRMLLKVRTGTNVGSVLKMLTVAALGVVSFRVMWPPEKVKPDAPSNRMDVTVVCPTVA